LLSLSDYRKGPSLDLDRVRLTRLKGSVSGESFVIPEAAKAVRAWLRRRGDVAGPLFPSRQRRPISRGRVFSLFRKYASAANLPPEKRFPHILKHSAISHLLEMGEDIIHTQRHAGHASIGSTMRYVHLGNLTTLKINNWSEAAIAGVECRWQDSVSGARSRSEGCASHAGSAYPRWPKLRLYVSAFSDRWVRGVGPQISRDRPLLAF